MIVNPFIVFVSKAVQEGLASIRPSVQPAESIDTMNATVLDESCSFHNARELDEPRGVQTDVSSQSEEMPVATAVPDAGVTAAASVSSKQRASVPFPKEQLFEINQEERAALQMQDSCVTYTSETPTQAVESKSIQQQSMLDEDEQPLGQAISQLHNTYILAQNKQGLVLVDMHALHERILYEKLKKQYASAGIASQQLLMPITVSVSRDEMLAFESAGDYFEAIGLSVGCLSPTEVSVRAIPALINEQKIALLIHDLFADLMVVGHSSQLQNDCHKRLATLACHSALRARSS